ncbi:DUF1080 domain-containing protein [Asticcacaulis sp. SL142]|uniref:3-keto-disaccharide hydrolase n=1 Tax=Asticcacaulis sp. SL142 TaxID=2995155 RepID=UPI00226C8E10|nr:DUF1080 domain-containing protein [Asticcacaulis sp. SL142]WAC49182.1 DUF1080 domain-containing protein [Asticcacaulis sp. SL142]
MLKKTGLFVLLLASVSSAGVAQVCDPVASDASVNRLTATETAQGWTLLWDGRTSDGWRGLHSDSFPAKGWSLCDGTLTIHEKGGEESQGGGDIITRARYSDFELSVDFKISPGANSGIKIFAQTDVSPIDRVTGKPVKVGSGIGMEFQVLDDDLHPDAKAGRDGNRTIGSFYDVMAAPKDKHVLPPGQWNNARILSKDGQVTYWLNGVKTVEFTRGSPAFRAAVAQSKFKDIPAFGEWRDGHILLQDHGNTVSFRNIKIRVPAGG